MPRPPQGSQGDRWLCHGQDLGQDLGKFSNFWKVIHASTGIHVTNTYKECQWWWDDHTPLIPRLVCRQLRTGWQKDCWSQIWGGETRGDPLCSAWDSMFWLVIPQLLWIICRVCRATMSNMFAEFSDQDAWFRSPPFDPEDSCQLVRYIQKTAALSVSESMHWLNSCFFFCMETRDFQKEVKDIPWISSLRASSALLSVAVPLHYVHFSFVECRAASRLGSAAPVKQHPLCFSVQTDRGEAVSLDSSCS